MDDGNEDMNRYLIMAIGVLVVLLSVSGWLLKGAVEDAAVAEAQRDGYANALQQQDDELAKRDAILATRERQRAQAQREAATWRRKWKEVQRNDPDCEAWGNVPLPACVIRLFELPGTGGGGENAASQPDGADTEP